MTRAVGGVTVAVAMVLMAAAAIPAAAKLPFEAAYRARIDGQFKVWLEGLKKDALAAGIRAEVFAAAFRGVRPDWRLPDLHPPGREEHQDNKPVRQAEFSGPARYFRERNIAALARIGAALRRKHAATLARIERRFKVPGNVVLAIWGRESAYGRVKIPYYAVRSLATLAFMGRRKPFFRAETIKALRILQEGHVSRDKMKSSWAGAMGHTQMLPSHFLKYAVDFDGDGRRDIWNSIPDALATTANHLAENGWRWGESWGYEIAPGAPCEEEGPDRRARIGEWVKRGVKRTRARRFANRHMGIAASLLMPAGVHGPAFLATRNFYVLKTYNESDLYALYVGHVADRINGGKRFATGWRKISTYTRARIKALQEKLIREGHDVGGADGLIGFKTRRSIGLWQKKKGLKVTCWPDPATLRKALEG